MILTIPDQPVKIKLIDFELDNIPTEGPFIAVCNRFSDLFEEMTLVEVLIQKRSDIKVLSFNRNISHSKNIIYINAKEKEWSKIKEKIISEIRKANKEDYPIVVFPGRRSMEFDLENFGWNKDIVKSIFLSKLPIIPIFGTWGSKIQKITTSFGLLLDTNYSPRKNQVHIRIGKPILNEKLITFHSSEYFRKFIYAKTYSIGNSLELEPIFFPDGKINFNPVVPYISDKTIELELSKLSEESLIVKKGNMEVYCASALQIPNILTQIGILRETTFREIGEGSGKSVDIDEYDVFYYQIFIWDSKKKKIVGGCRMAYVDWVLQYYGKKGLYSNSLFQYKSKMIPYLNKSIELGRSFIIKEYQKEYLPLYVMWKAIYEIVNKNDEYEYIIGAVSISDSYTEISKKHLIHYLQNYHKDETLSNYIEPRNQFRMNFTSIEKDEMKKSVQNQDITSYENVVSDLEPKFAKMPILIKQYLKQNARFLGFSVDENFSNVVDGLMILNINELPAATEELLKKSK
jgi:putative hemolysin